MNCINVIKMNMVINREHLTQSDWSKNQLRKTENVIDL